MSRVVHARSSCHCNVLHDHRHRPAMNRRDFLGITAAVGATLALPPELLRALQQPGGKLLQRAIPSTGEKLPVISFGARCVGGAALSSQPADVVAIQAVLRTFLDNGGKVV